MFDNIGRKIMALAKVLCWIGIICYIIVGFILMFAVNLLIGLAVGGIGSLLSWIGSFFAYGLGQLIENSDIIVSQNKKLIGMKSVNESTFNNTNSTEEKSTHYWRCSSCGKLISVNPCPHCHNDAQQKEKSSAQFWCGVCGKEGPYEGNCPVCGSSLKIFNAYR